MDQPPIQIPTPKAPVVERRPQISGIAKLFMLRRPIRRWQALAFSLLCIVLCYGAWWFVTRGEPEMRIMGPGTLPSPHETFSSFNNLWVQRQLPANIWASLRRVILGFGLAAAVGIPVGILCGCFLSLNAFLMPITVFGRNIPVAALIPLTFSLFGIDETQKIMFIFIACVAFIISDTARAIGDVGSQYADTAFTLGAGRWQVILKVFVPLSMPSVFNSLRLLFGLAFGYIMLAELVSFGGASGGLGDIINTSQRRNLKEHIILVLLIIPMVALVIDRVLYWIQCELFPYRYGGRGLLHRGVRFGLHGWEDFKGMFWQASGDRSMAAPGLPAKPRAKK